MVLNQNFSANIKKKTNKSAGGWYKLFSLQPLIYHIFDRFSPFELFASLFGPIDKQMEVDSGKVRAFEKGEGVSPVTICIP